MRPPRFLLLVLLLLGAFARAEEPFFKKGDVIAIVGGEDMVALSEYGYLELLLTRALPDHHLRFRNLAWEGDTVFEQRRDLNFPPWEEQLAKIGATVVLCQFGQMESLAGKEKLPEFIAAYKKLIERFSGRGKRRVCVIEPFGFYAVYDDEEMKAPAFAWLREHSTAFLDYQSAIDSLAPKADSKKPAAISLLPIFTGTFSDAGWPNMLGPDKTHLSSNGQLMVAQLLAVKLEVHFQDMVGSYYPGDERGRQSAHFRELLIAKNRLWFDYWRVQNWAFLAGDRTNQPSSRDHLDPAKRWFPEERERFLPLIEAREKEIDALAAKLAQP